MSLADLGPKSGSRHDYILNWTARSSAIQGDKGVNDATHLTEGGPAEIGGLTASNLPLIPLPVRHICQTVRREASAQG